MSEELNQAPVGRVAANLMERIEGIVEREGRLPKIGVVALVVELDWPAEEEGRPGSTEVLYHCNDPRRWVQKGIFQAAAAAVDRVPEV